MHDMIFMRVLLLVNKLIFAHVANICVGFGLFHVEFDVTWLYGHCHPSVGLLNHFGFHPCVVVCAFDFDVF